MYGTVAHLRVTQGREREFEELARSYDDMGIDGFRGTWIYRLDGTPSTYVMAVAFEDAATYRRNADDPAQDRRYREMRALLDGDPTWEDGEIVWATTAPGMRVGTSA